MTAIHDPVGNVRHGETGTLATLLLGKEHSAPLWRHWARSCHLAQARAHDGRRRDRHERAGQGFSLYGAIAKRRGALIKALDTATETVAHVRVGSMLLKKGS
jgi:hypothetical protein